MSLLADAVDIIKSLLGMRGRPKKGKRVDVAPLPPHRPPCVCGFCNPRKGRPS